MRWSRCFRQINKRIALFIGLVKGGFVHVLRRSLIPVFCVFDAVNLFSKQMLYLSFSYYHGNLWDFWCVFSCYVKSFFLCRCIVCVKCVCWKIRTGFHFWSVGCESCSHMPLQIKSGPTAWFFRVLFHVYLVFFYGFYPLQFIATIRLHHLLAAFRTVTARSYIL